MVEATNAEALNLANFKIPKVDKKAAEVPLTVGQDVTEAQKQSLLAPTGAGEPGDAGDGNLVVGASGKVLGYRPNSVVSNTTPQSTEPGSAENSIPEIPKRSKIGQGVYYPLVPLSGPGSGQPKLYLGPPGVGNRHDQKPYSRPKTKPTSTVTAPSKGEVGGVAVGQAAPGQEDPGFVTSTPIDRRSPVEDVVSSEAAGQANPLPDEDTIVDSDNSADPPVVVKPEFAAEEGQGGGKTLQEEVAAKEQGLSQQEELDQHPERLDYEPDIPSSDGVTRDWCEGDDGDDVTIKAVGKPDPESELNSIKKALTESEWPKVVVSVTLDSAAARYVANAQNAQSAQNAQTAQNLNSNLEASVDEDSAHGTIDISESQEADSAGIHGNGETLMDRGIFTQTPNNSVADLDDDEDGSAFGAGSVVVGEDDDVEDEGDADAARRMEMMLDEEGSSENGFSDGSGEDEGLISKFIPKNGRNMARTMIYEIVFF